MPLYLEIEHMCASDRLTGRYQYFEGAIHQSNQLKRNVISVF